MSLIAELEDGYTLNFDSQKLYHNGQFVLRITAQQADLLKYLYENPKQKAKELADKFFCSDITIRQHIHNLKNCHNIFIKCIDAKKNEGYSFIVRSVRDDNLYSNLFLLNGKDSRTMDVLAEIGKEKKHGYYVLYIIAPSDFEYLEQVNSAITTIMAHYHNTTQIRIYGFILSFPLNSNYDYLFYRCDCLIGLFNSKADLNSKYKGKTMHLVLSCNKIQKPACLLIKAKSEFSLQNSALNDNKTELDKLRLRYHDERRRDEYTYYSEYISTDIEAILIKMLHKLISDGKFRVTRDSDIISREQNHEQICKEINGHTALVARNFIYRNFEENYPQEIWTALAEKLSHAVVYLKEALFMLVDYEAFDHPLYYDLITRLAYLSFDEYHQFLQYLHGKNYDECIRVDSMGLASDDNINIYNFHKKLYGNDYNKRSNTHIRTLH